ncbi:MAG: hypothetical protein ACU833_13125 [Gammaproteobacteria bacterium]
MAVNAFLYYTYIVESYDFIFKYSPLSQELIDERYRDLHDFGVGLALTTLLIISILACWGLFITHRAAGSVYHFKRVFQEIRSGNKGERIRLREKDEFKDVADEFNQLMDELQND